MAKYRQTSVIDPRWDFETAVAEISDRWRPGGLGSGPARNRLIESWGQLVGRERALRGMQEAVDRYGSKTAAARALQMSPKTIGELMAYFEGLPSNKTPGALYSGTTLASWTLTARLGQGGNAEVWRATSAATGEAAIKILNSRRPNTEPYLRFADEVRVLGLLNGRSGVLPLLEAHVPVELSDGDRAWIAMPIAEPITERVKGDRQIATVVEGMGTVASTLASLHVEGYCHRDLKPENLFRWQDAWVLADFGLASFPGKAAHTTDAKKLGSMHYLAPEMLNEPAGADGGPADVYSLAKTVWVLATGQNYPLPGTQPAQGFGSLSHFLGQDLPALDQLLHEATNLSPTLRPTMSDLAARLAALTPRSDT